MAIRTPVSTPYRAYVIVLRLFFLEPRRLQKLRTLSSEEYRVLKEGTSVKDLLIN